jgi:hypothetical protein
MQSKDENPDRPECVAATGRGLSLQLSNVIGTSRMRLPVVR